MPAIRFKSPTDARLYVASLDGQCARIGSDWRELPPTLHAAAIAAGAVTDNMDRATVALQVAKTAPAASPTPEGDPETRIREALLDMLDSDDPDAFTKSGAPDVTRLSARVGFDVGRAQALAAWREVSAALKADAEEHAGAPG